MKKSILFVRPDYHCSFFYRDEFRRQGWKADIFCDLGYPEKLLYSKNDILRPPQLKGKSKLSKLLNQGLILFWYVSHFWRYKYHFYYGPFTVFSFLEKRFDLGKIFGKDVLFSLSLAKLFGCKIIYLPTGCHDMETKANFSQLDKGNICGNCGSFDSCHDLHNQNKFQYVRRYSDLNIGTGTLDSSQFKATHFKYKAIDLDLWSPDLQIPPEYRLPPTSNLRILHSFYDYGRSFQGRNIKGSPFVVEAIQKLRRNGYPVEYMYFNDKPSNQIRFYQAQADIVVEQLIYGWWGSTGVETMALGKPVVCYLRPEWKLTFLKTFPEYQELPIVEANTNNIYSALKKLVDEVDYRQRKGSESRKFAEAHFNTEKNTKTFVEILEAL